MDVPKPPRGLYQDQGYPGMGQIPTMDDELLLNVKSAKELADLASSYVSRQVMLHTNLDLTACELDRLFKVIHTVSEENSKCLFNFIIDYHAKLRATGADLAQRNHGPVIWLLSELLKISIEPVGNVVLCLHVLHALLSNEDNIKFVVDYHLTGVVLGSMAAHCYVREVQLYGCAILAELSRYLPDQSRTAKAMVREAAVDIVLQTVHNFPEDLEIVRWSTITMATVATTLNTIIKDPEKYSDDCRELHGAALTYIRDKCTPVVIDLQKKYTNCDTVQRECQRFLDVFKCEDRCENPETNGLDAEVKDASASVEEKFHVDYPQNTHVSTELESFSYVNRDVDKCAAETNTSLIGFSGSCLAVPDEPTASASDDLTSLPHPPNKSSAPNEDNDQSSIDNHNIGEGISASLTHSNTASSDDHLDADVTKSLTIDKNASTLLGEHKTVTELVDSSVVLDRQVVSVPDGITSSRLVDDEITCEPVCDNIGSLPCVSVVDSSIAEMDGDRAVDPVLTKDVEFSVVCEQKEECDDFVKEDVDVPSISATETAGGENDSKDDTDLPNASVTTEMNSSDVTGDVVAAAGEETYEQDGPLDETGVVSSDLTHISSSIEDRSDLMEGSGIIVTVTHLADTPIVSDGTPTGIDPDDIAVGVGDDGDAEKQDLQSPVEDDKVSDPSLSSQNVDSLLNKARSELSNSQSSSNSLNLECERLQLRRSTYCVPKPKSDDVPRVNGSTPSISEIQSPVSDIDIDEQEFCPCQGFGARHTTADSRHESHDLEILSDIENDSLEKSLETPDDVSDIPSYNDCNSVDEDSYSLSDCCSEDHHSPREYSMPSRSISCPGLESYYRSFDKECPSDENLSEEDDDVDEDLIDGKFATKSRGERRAWGSIHPPDVEGLLANRTPSMVADTVEDLRKVRLMHLPPSHSDPNLSLERKCWDVMPLHELLYLEEKSLESRSVSEVSSGASQSSEPDEEGILDYLMSQAHGYMVKLLVCRTQMMLYVLSYWNRKRYLTVFDILGRPVVRVLEDVRLPAEIADFARSRQSETVHTAFVDILSQLSKVSHCMKSKMIQKLLLASEKLLVQPIPTSLSMKVCDSVEVIFVRWKQPDKKSIQSMLTTVSKLQAKDETEDEIRIKLNHLLAVVEQYCEK